MNVKNLMVLEKKWKSLYIHTKSFYFEKSQKIYSNL